MICYNPLYNLWSDQAGPHTQYTIPHKTITQTITQTIPGGTTQNQHTNNTQYKTNNTKITKNKQAIH